MGAELEVDPWGVRQAAGAMLQSLDPGVPVVGPLVATGAAGASSEATALMAEVVGAWQRAEDLQRGTGRRVRDVAEGLDALVRDATATDDRARDAALAAARRKGTP